MNSSDDSKEVNLKLTTYSGSYPLPPPPPPPPPNVLRSAMRLVRKFAHAPKRNVIAALECETRTLEVGVKYKSRTKEKHVLLSSFDLKFNMKSSDGILIHS